MSGPDAEGSSVAVLAEKPSVARDIARVLGATKQGQGYLHGNGYVVTWAIGHLVALAQPHEIQPEWKHWRRDLLPMLPRDWPLVVYDKTKDQFEVVRKILNSPRVASVVCATDAGREGELIFRYIYEAAGCRKPFRRLWISSLTPDAIRKGFGELKDGTAYDPLADAARGRSRADWLVGMNLSRAYTLAMDDDLSVGRVQTPTLAMLVERELAIRAFVPEDYMEVLATFSPVADAQIPGNLVPRTGQGFHSDGHAAAGRWRRSGAHCGAGAHGRGAHRIHPVRNAAHGAAAALRSHRTAAARQSPVWLQRAEDARNRAGALREPQADQLSAHGQPPSLAGCGAHPAAVVRAIEAPYRRCWRRAPASARWAAASWTMPRSPITTPSSRQPMHAGDLTADERKIYDLICRRLLSAWHDDHIWAVTTVITAIANSGVIDRYHTTGTAVQQAGWKALDVVPERRQERAPETPTLAARPG